MCGAGGVVGGEEGEVRWGGGREGGKGGGGRGKGGTMAKIWEIEVGSSCFAYEVGSVVSRPSYLCKGLHWWISLLPSLRRSPRV